MTRDRGQRLVSVLQSVDFPEQEAPPIPTINFILQKENAFNSLACCCQKGKLCHVLTCQTTGLFGLAPHPQPREALETLYARLLLTLGRLPATAHYRISTEALVRQRLEVVESTESIPELESKLKAGQVEELIVQAQNELQLAEKMMEFKGWEELETPAPAGQWTR